MTENSESRLTTAKEKHLK